MKRKKQFKIIFATTNQNKIKEFIPLCNNFGIDYAIASDYLPNFDVEETGNTYGQNAYIKACGLRDALEDSKLPVNAIIIAEDSGMEAICENGSRNGVYTARTDKHLTEEERNQNLIELANKTGQREISYICAISAITPDGVAIVTQGCLNGIIHDKQEGENNFKLFDPIFYIPDENRTLAEMTSDEKNEISHRAQAFSDMLITLIKIL